MPCFHGLAVSIHTTGPGGGPLAEFGIQKQAKYHRITSHVPVPTPKLQPHSTTPEPATFAISITLLTPGLAVPYSQPLPTPDDPHPRPKIVGGANDTSSFRGKHSGFIAPYQPCSNSSNETIAAYIYFDGRGKEEVATLLRRGEETWVNSRWVSVPDSEGGGLAEKEFIFREVGLERWLNGLDLEGKDAKAAAATVEKRRQRFERKRRIKKEPGSDDEDMDGSLKKLRPRERDNNGVLRYGEDRNMPVQSMSDQEEESNSSDSEDDDEPMPEAAGQIKVALFRVLASGEVKRGEYSPQFDVHDDEDQMGGGGEQNEDIDHTTSFAKPKTLDPKTISTQTVTGIDPPDKPYAVFTFLYRGAKQLQKMGIMAGSPNPEKTAAKTKRKSTGIDFGNLAPLSSSAAGRKRGELRAAPSPPKKQDSMDSDDEDEEEDRRPKIKEEDDEKEMSRTFLTAEEMVEESKLSDELRKTKLKRAHSAEPVHAAASPRELEPKHSPTTSTPPTSNDLPPVPSLTASNGNLLMPPPANVHSAVPDLGAESAVQSPFKKQRSSLPGLDGDMRRKIGEAAAVNAEPRRESESAVTSASSALANALNSVSKDFAPLEKGQLQLQPSNNMEEEEL